MLVLNSPLYTHWNSDITDKSWYVFTRILQIIFSFLIKTYLDRLVSVSCDWAKMNHGIFTSCTHQQYLSNEIVRRNSYCMKYYSTHHQSSRILLYGLYWGPMFWTFYICTIQQGSPATGGPWYVSRTWTHF